MSSRDITNAYKPAGSVEMLKKNMHNVENRSHRPSPWPHSPLCSLHIMSNVVVHNGYIWLLDQNHKLCSRRCVTREDLKGHPLTVAISQTCTVLNLAIPPYVLLSYYTLRYGRVMKMGHFYIVLQDHHKVGSKTASLPLNDPHHIVLHQPHPVYMLCMRDSNCVVYNITTTWWISKNTRAKGVFFCTFDHFLQCITTTIIHLAQTSISIEMKLLFKYYITKFLPLRHHLYDYIHDGHFDMSHHKHSTPQQGYKVQLLWDRYILYNINNIMTTYHDY